MKEMEQKTKRKVLLAGSSCVDVHVYIDHLPEKEEDINASDMVLTPGGCARNAAEVLKIEGVPFTFLTPQGSGTFGDFMRDHLKSLDVTPVDVPGENGACFCLVTPEGDRTFLTVHGAEYDFPEDLFDHADPKDYAYLYLSGIDVEADQSGVLTASAERFAKEGVRLFFAPGPRITHLNKNVLELLLSCHPVLHLNRREYEALNRRLEGHLEEKTYALIITNGASPVEVRENGARTFCPTVPVVQKDGTGAGDAHAGAVLAGLCRGEDLVTSVLHANRVSAEKISKAR